MRRSMFVLAGLAVLAAVTAAMFGMLAEGGGKAEATTPITITATATGSQTPPFAPALVSPPGCSVQNGAFVISSTFPPPVSGCGDGVDEFTRWTFDFTTDPGYPAFKVCGPLTSALLTLEVVVPDTSTATDGVLMQSKGLTPYVQSLPMNSAIQVLLPLSVNIVQRDWVVQDGLGAGILSLFNATTPGEILMQYQDDAIVSFAKLELTVNCTAGPPAVGGIVGLRGDADSPADASGSSSARDYTAPITALAAAVVIALVAGGWYARRRWLR